MAYVTIDTLAAAAEETRVFLLRADVKSIADWDSFIPDDEGILWGQRMPYFDFSQPRFIFELNVDIKEGEQGMPSRTYLLSCLRRGDGIDCLNIEMTENVMRVPKGKRNEFFSEYGSSIVVQKTMAGFPGYEAFSHPHYVMRTFPKTNSGSLNYIEDELRVLFGLRTKK